MKTLFVCSDMSNIDRNIGQRAWQILLTKRERGGYRKPYTASLKLN